MHQRLALARKGEAVDLLVLTATPIPRTLVLTYFGDMDISELREKPAGRQKIDTRAVPLDRLAEVIEAVARALDAGRRVYWVCPLVEESESVDLAAAEERYEALQKRFGDTRRSRPWPHAGRRERSRHGALRQRRNATSRRHDGDRSRRRRAGSERDGDRARRTFRACATASVARPHRPRRRALDLYSALQSAARPDRESPPRDFARNRRRLPHRRGRFTAARRRRRARHAAKRRCPVSASRASSFTASSCRGARRRRAGAGARSKTAIAARRGAARICSICSRATRRSGCWTRADQAGRPEGIGAEPVRDPAVPRLQAQHDQHENADER